MGICVYVCMYACMHLWIICFICHQALSEIAAQQRRYSHIQHVFQQPKPHDTQILVADVEGDVTRLTAQSVLTIHDGNMTTCQ